MAPTRPEHIDSWPERPDPARRGAGQRRGPKEQTAAIVSSYQRTLKAYNAVDFNDLILLPVKLFQENRDIPEKWQTASATRWVDE